MFKKTNEEISYETRAEMISRVSSVGKNSGNSVQIFIPVFRRPADYEHSESIIKSSDCSLKKQNNRFSSDSLSETTHRKPSFLPLSLELFDEPLRPFQPKILTEFKLPKKTEQISFCVTLFKKISLEVLESIENVDFSIQHLVTSFPALCRTTPCDCCGQSEKNIFELLIGDLRKKYVSGKRRPKTRKTKKKHPRPPKTDLYKKTNLIRTIFNFVVKKRMLQSEVISTHLKPSRKKLEERRARQLVFLRIYASESEGTLSDLFAKSWTKKSEILFENLKFKQDFGKALETYKQEILSDYKLLFDSITEKKHLLLRAYCGRRNNIQLRNLWLERYFSLKTQNNPISSKTPLKPIYEVFPLFVLELVRIRLAEQEWLSL